jgi:hypothetical protein
MSARESLKKYIEEKAEETILLIGGRKISEPVYEIGGKEY